MGQSKSKQNMASPINAEASSSSSSLPHSSTDHQSHYTYDVFLSFRGKDTRYNFSDHLYNALCQRGIETFRDDKLTRGEDISQELLNCIEESRVSIVVFSQNYASSRWCLDELVKILECRELKGQEFRAVFYKVAPSDVRHQTGDFGDAFAKLDECKYKESIGKWRKALEKAANLSGWTFEEGRYETEFIKEIVEDLFAQVINPSWELHVADHPIGLESCREEVSKLLDAEENNMVGIWGPGGIGKTTIAKSVFNSIRHKFEGSSCFLADVRAKSITQLQETLLLNILGKNLKVHSVDEGVGLIKTMMRRKIVLLILDDVSDSSQLKKLVPSLDCFRPGSRILITTRDKRWLIAHEVNEVYEVKMLDDCHALKLFSLHAFKRNGPPSDYLELARRAVRYAGGLPLALTVLGSHLFGRSREEWEATLDSCRGEDPHREIRDILKISYDALRGDLQGYFLDIACFFKGKLVDNVKSILEACYDLKSVIGIAQLQEKALIRIDNENYYGGRIWMHDLIEEMGKDIVHQESPKEPGKCSRVWSEEGVDDVLTNNTGTNNVVGFQAPRLLSTISLNAKNFSEMKKLRYISMHKNLKYECVSRDIDYLSNQLRWLDWPNSPLQSFPSDFHANKLVKLNIPDSCRITRLWKGRKNFSRLTCMNLRGCESLTELPDFSGISNLKKLDLCGCRSLVEVPDSVGFLPNLVILNLRGCESLTELPDFSGISNLKELDLCGCRSLVEVPDSVGFLPNLVILNLRGCESLTELPDFSGISNLKELDLCGCRSLVEVPDSVGFLPNLIILNLSGCESLTELPDFSGIPNLKELYLCGCKSLVEVHDFVGFFPKIVILDLWGCESLIELPDVSGIPNLKELYLCGCKSLVEVHDFVGFLPKIVILDLWGCESLIELPDVSGIPNLKELYLCGCKSLVKVHDSVGFLPNLVILNLRGCESLTKLPDFSGTPNLTELDLFMCSNLVEVPDSVGFLHNLVTLNVDGCSNLIMFPRKINWKFVETISISECKLVEFSEVGEEMGFLRKLDLSDTCIRELHPSITKLIGLKELELWNCENLTILPDNICKLHNLEVLDAMDCRKLATFPEIPIKMDSLRCLHLSDSDIRELDESIGNLIGLEWLDLRNCKNLTTLPCSIYGLQNLKELDLNQCSKLVRFPTNANILNVDVCSLSLPELQWLGIRGCSLLSDCDFLMTLDCWETLRSLDLSRNNFVSLPACFTKFVNLQDLDLDGCKRLREIPELPPNVAVFTTGCESLIEASSPPNCFS